MSESEVTPSGDESAAAVADDVSGLPVTGEFQAL